VDGRLGLGKNLFAASPVLRDQFNEIVAIGSVGAEGLLVKQTLDATPQANLIGMILEAHRPTHLAMPATAEDYDSSRSQTRRNDSERPQPTRLLFHLTHCTTCKSFQRLRICSIQRARNGFRKAMNRKGLEAYQRAWRYCLPSCAENIAIPSKPL
jgi:hypothetical protein